MQEVEYKGYIVIPEPTGNPDATWAGRVRVRGPAGNEIRLDSGEAFKSEVEASRGGVEFARACIDGRVPGRDLSGL